MRRLSVDLIKGNEILARPVYTSTNMILLTKGVQIKKAYVNKLKEIGIEYIYVVDEYSKGVILQDSIREETRGKSKKEIKNVIETFSSQNKLELDKLIMSAENIIEDLLNQKEVVVNITDIRTKDEYIYGHSVNVCALAVLLALKAGMNRKRIKDIAIGALLHDLGKVLIPPEILEKNNRTDKEEQEYRNHVIYGYEAVKEDIWLSPVSKVIILTHHERVNGVGYPFGWEGKKIHDSSKIVAICDTFDLLTTKKIEGKPHKVYEVIEYLVSQSGKLFDKDLVEEFIKNIAVYPSGIGVITNNNEKGIVLRQNKNIPSRPVIRIIEDKNGNQINEWKEIDLVKELTTFIIDTVEI
ncbi:HD-GYP domain-containing protein (c-di-GMP phosphodiesterase class II) [Natranaerovirga hydrolytica]|uniref:HD-GYP domain-containing protein (C-di-GMP phosphodiesterase class II) n=1 Tax=Natranaerovirga hydrolytica TaxID=680378 RepID=A0A4V2PYP5_9FIRM|nr:HD-GYP domain-containing protein [Natranaerovirga hydrolytica]TCK86771.1 HD-GYP domain-containing protein (c-di-GMP phosphodiesterase class II) [Natranaerovirga hydrolytica]